MAVSALKNVNRFPSAYANHSTCRARRCGVRTLSGLDKAPRHFNGRLEIPNGHMARDACSPALVNEGVVCCASAGVTSLAPDFSG